MEVVLAGKIVFFDEEDEPLYMSRKWHINNCGYLMGKARGNETPEKVMFHRLVLGALHGQIIDHVNGNPLDNRKVNLRFCTHAENMRNRKTHGNNASGIKGVQRCSDSRFRARITVNGRRIEIGSFRSAEDAGKAYAAAARHYFGNFARAMTSPHA